MPNKRSASAARARRKRLIRSISHGGPLAPAQRLQQMQRERLVRMQSKSSWNARVR
jgi:hypothetical protein